MRRSAICVCASLIITPMLVGCSSLSKKTDVQRAEGSTDMYASAAEQTPADERVGTYDPYAEYPSATATEPSYDTELNTSGPRYHTVIKKDTLYSLARTYYNDQRRWKDIYNANRAEIGDPNKIYVGQRLLIP